MSQRCKPNKSSLNRCDVTYNVVVAGLGLASQEVDVLANQPMKIHETSMAMIR
jgi:hypothetical protein